MLHCNMRLSTFETICMWSVCWIWLLVRGSIADYGKSLALLSWQDLIQWWSLIIRLEVRFHSVPKLINCVLRIMEYFLECFNLLLLLSCQNWAIFIGDNEIIYFWKELDISSIMIVMGAAVIVEGSLWRRHKTLLLWIQIV
jgi:hypothetical protein